MTSLIKATVGTKEDDVVKNVGKMIRLSVDRIALLRILPETGFEGVGVVQATIVEGECSQIPNGGERDLGAL